MPAAALAATRQPEPQQEEGEEDEQKVQAQDGSALDIPYTAPSQESPNRNKRGRRNTVLAKSKFMLGPAIERPTLKSLITESVFKGVVTVPLTCDKCGSSVIIVESKPEVARI